MLASGACLPGGAGLPARMWVLRDNTCVSPRSSGSACALLFKPNVLEEILASSSSRSVPYVSPPSPECSQAGFTALPFLPPTSPTSPWPRRKNVPPGPGSLSIFPLWHFIWNRDSLKAGKGHPKRAAQSSLPPRRPFGPGLGRVPRDGSSSVLATPRQVGLSPWVVTEPGRNQVVSRIL